MSDNKLPPIDVSENSGRFKNEAEWLQHLEKYKKQNPEKYIAKERVGDFEKQAILLGFGKPKVSPEELEAKKAEEKAAKEAEKAAAKAAKEAEKNK